MLTPSVIPWLELGLGFVLTLIAGGLSWLIRSAIRQSEAIAILIEHNIRTDGGLIDAKKMHDEVLDNKLATATLDQTTIDLGRRVLRLENMQDNTAR